MNTIIVGNDGKGIWGHKIIEYLFKINGHNIEWTNDINNCSIVVRNLFSPKYNSYKVPYITVSGESKYTPTCSDNNCKLICDLTTLTNTNKPNNYFYVPYAFFADYDYKNIKKYTNVNREYFVGYCASHAVPIREQLFKLLLEKDKLVIGLGRCSSTPGHKIAGGWNDVIETYSKYYFIFAMENTIADGYVTEKIMNAYIAGAIPIYWGDKKVKEWFNPKSFINVNNFKNLQECADYIYELYMDKERLKNMMNEPIFINNICPDILKYDLEDVPTYYKEIADYIKNNGF